MSSRKADSELIHELCKDTLHGEGDNAYAVSLLQVGIAQLLLPFRKFEQVFASHCDIHPQNAARLHVPLFFGIHLAGH
ncbi:hypothetical protein AV540_06090 [Brevibacillus parabrevis]|nr:hypothetical protein AV540_06090 [Brevibacillus parabrevis]